MSNTATETPELLSPREASRLLGNIGRDAVYRLCTTRERGFPVIRIGRKYLIPRRALLEWLDREATATGSESV